jgi:hypothetical protein
MCTGTVSAGAGICGGHGDGGRAGQTNPESPVCLGAFQTSDQPDIAERTDMDVEARIADLEREIERGEPRLLVSFAIQSFVEGPFDYDTGSVVPIIDDIVDRWWGLSVTERDEYARRNPSFRPLRISPGTMRSAWRNSPMTKSDVIYPTTSTMPCVSCGGSTPSNWRPGATGGHDCE